MQTAHLRSGYPPTRRAVESEDLRIVIRQVVLPTAAPAVTVVQNAQATGGRLGRAAFRAALRATNTVPPLKRQFARALDS